jgi:heptaprenyl diphosphate synthase
MIPRHAWIGDIVVGRQLGAVEQLINHAAGLGGECPPFHEQLLAPESKRLRPALLLLAARFGSSGAESPLLAAAAGIELLHEATLYHDDIVDEAEQRRSRRSVQRACGPVTAALAGGELLFATAELFAELPVAVRHKIGRAGDRLCHGQLRELEMLGDLTCTMRQRLRVMRDKTATLFSLSTQIGSVLGGVDRGVRAQLARFGTRFGLCFQLADDLLDLSGPSQQLGRQPGSDLRDGVYTLPILHALRQPSDDSRRLRDDVIRLHHAPQPTLIARARARVRRAGGLAWGSALLMRWLEMARNEVPAPTVENAPARESLLRLIEQLRAAAIDRVPLTSNRATSLRLAAAHDGFVA